MDRNSLGAKADSPTKWVALRKESVDRNDIAELTAHLPLVALRKESVDRNQEQVLAKIIRQVALRKESVDRN